jgi:general secretion pathway protein G
MRWRQMQAVASGVVLVLVLILGVAVGVWLKPNTPATVVAASAAAAPVAAAPAPAAPSPVAAAPDPAALAAQVTELKAVAADIKNSATEITSGVAYIKGMVADAHKSVAAAGREARTSNLKTNLQTVRSQMLLYKVQHNEQYPGSSKDPSLFAKQMTMYTDISGQTADRPAPSTNIDSLHPFGPYLQKVPENSFSGKSTVVVVEGATTAFSPPREDGGWWLNATTGEFRANLTDSWTAEDGTRLNRF